eukprot:g6254.t1
MSSPVPPVDRYQPAQTARLDRDSFRESYRDENPRQTQSRSAYLSATGYGAGGEEVRDMKKQLAAKNAQVSLLQAENARMAADIRSSKNEFQAQRQYIDTLKIALNMRAEDFQLPNGEYFVSAVELRAALDKAEGQLETVKREKDRVSSRLDESKNLLKELHSTVKEVSARAVAQAKVIKDLKAAES